MHNINKVWSYLVVFILPFTFLANAQAQPDNNSEEKRVRAWEQKMIQKRIDSNHAILDLIPVILNSSGVKEFIEVTNEQERQLIELQKELEKEKRSLNEFSLSPDQRKANLADFRSRHLKQFNEIFLPFQLELMLRWTPRSGGIPKLLTETPIGKTLGLTEAQMEKIREQSNELALEIQKFHDDTRRKAREIVIGQLTKDQKKGLSNVVGKKELEKIFSSSQLDEIFSAYLYQSLNDKKKQKNLRHTDFDDN